MAKVLTWGRHLEVVGPAVCLVPVEAPTFCRVPRQYLQLYFLYAPWRWPILETCARQVPGVFWKVLLRWRLLLLQRQ
ncbi:MAG: hypothetical protein A3F78_11815 [Burkholderiales bacterium RIFCSPLOWO2_12_FULL_61_40]|nr:MAG: hypothetical protein A3F78_11815 [Burkholderiales bacterium RIFCSPLOWO2_12_FULL_61_40]